MQKFQRAHEASPLLYYALLLEPTPDSKFKRVGVAMLFSHALQALQAELAEVEII